LKDFAGPVATVFAASAAAWIALRLGLTQAAIAKSQADIARDKLKFDLFELRYNIYTKLKELIEYCQSAHDYEKIDRMRVRALYVKLEEGRFFFDPRVISFIIDVQRVGEERFGFLEARWQVDASDDFVEQIMGCDISLREAYAEAPEIFESALRFDQVTGSVGKH
jgi:hypothetical protein